jgi:hypothetical protein
MEKKIFCLLFMLLFSTAFIFSEVVILKDESILKCKINKIDDAGLVVTASFGEVVIKRENIKKIYFDDVAYDKEFSVEEEKTVAIENNKNHEKLIVNEYSYDKFTGIKLDSGYNEIINQIKSSEFIYDLRKKDNSIIIWGSCFSLNTPYYTFLRFKKEKLVDIVMTFENNKLDINKLIDNLNLDLVKNEDSGRYSMEINDKMIEVYSFTDKSEKLNCLHVYNKDSALSFDKLNYNKIEFGIGGGFSHAFSQCIPLGFLLNQSLSFYLPFSFSANINPVYQLGFESDFGYKALFVYGYMPSVHNISEKIKITNKWGDPEKKSRFMFQIGANFQVVFNMFDLNYNISYSPVSFMAGPSFELGGETRSNKNNFMSSTSFFFDFGLGKIDYVNYYYYDDYDYESDSSGASSCSGTSFLYSFDVGITFKWMATPHVVF